MDDLEQLRQIAQGLGIKVHHKHTAETLKAKINQQQGHLVADVMKHRAEISLEPSNINSQEDIEKVVKPFMKEGFTLKFLPDDTWYMAYKGREESGHMSAALRIIAQKASNVAAGAIRPRSLGRDGTYGQSYADTILA
jgi:hypothetical protein